jgi:serine/threonine protein kinase
VIPPYFAQRVPENLVTIIQWLVENDPAKRPSALELQSSPLMPPRIELDKLYLEEVMSVLKHNSDTVQSVITTLFKRKHPTGVHDVGPDDREEAYRNTNNHHFNYDFELYSRSLRLLNPCSVPSSSLLSQACPGTSYTTPSPVQLHDAICRITEKVHCPVICTVLCAFFM